MGDKTGIEAKWQNIAAANRAGVPVDEYVRRRNAGEKRCTQCLKWLPLSEFKADRSRCDGRGYNCHACARITPAFIPNSRDKKLAKAKGLAWCSKCAAWKEKAAMTKRSLCRQHQREDDRRRYSQD